MTDLDRALVAADAAWPAQLERLKALVRIPSCSFPGFDHAEVARSADATAAWLREAGFPEVRIISGFQQALPYVVAHDRRAGPDAPTILLYAHHDVQPPMRQEVWRSPPYEPTERDGRLYGRGAADDKAGVLVHAAAAQAWNATAGRPPVNLVVLIEGEEESGSKHMEAFLRAHADELRCDALVIADLANVDVGLPSITTSLRGHVGAVIELRALKSPLHSGMWGGAVPDVLMALSKMLASVTDDAGRIRVAGLTAGVRPPTPDEAAGFARVPYDPARFAEQAGLPAGTPMPDAATLFTRLWREPSFAINGIHAGTKGQVGNVIMDAAWARVGLRIVPDQRPEQVFAALREHLRAHCPAGMELTVTPASQGAPWATGTGHPLFAAARAALADGFGCQPVEIGCGASIPFVATMSELLGGVPAILVGVEDPACAAHAENESVHLGDLRKALRSEIAFLAHAATCSRR